MVVETVKELDLQKYTGRWYEVYSTLIQRTTFQRNLCCTTATYTLGEGNTINVSNSGCISNAKGEKKTSQGVAVYDPEKPGQLTVGFKTPPKDNNKPNYMVAKLGPETYGEDGKYEYAIISAPSKALMWVLARHPKTFKEKYNEEVLTFLREQGFTRFWNRPRETYQGDDCGYPEDETSAASASTVPDATNSSTTDATASTAPDATNSSTTDATASTATDATASTATDASASPASA